MNNPRVYVGTYHKYNCGSIAGDWINLRDCKDYQDFLHKCAVLHRDEREPEFMIQDTEDMPDGLSCGECMDEQTFNDIMEAANEDDDGETLADRLRMALMQLGNNKSKAQPKRGDDKALLAEYMQEMQKAWTSQDMLDYFRKKFSSAVRLQNGGILYFEKPTIENRFCFHDEGVDYDNYRHVTSTDERLEKYFLNQNLAGFDKEIKELQSLEHDYKTLFIQRESYSGEKEPLNIWRWCFWSEGDMRNRPWFYEGDKEKMTEADRKVILEGVKHEREKFEKRLHTYLKRYGTSKIRTWTYWADA